MDDFGLRPEAPQWALDAGLPAPKEDEGFSEYATRLGYDADILLEDLTERKVCIANLRLAAAMQRTMPHLFDAHVEALVKEHISPERRKFLEQVAISTWNARYRHPTGGVSLRP